MNENRGIKCRSAGLLFCITAVAVVGHAHAAEDTNSAAIATHPPPAETTFDDGVNGCILCHTMPELFPGEKQSFYISPEDLTSDAHLKKGIRCHECHGGDPTALEPRGAHATEFVENDLGITPFRLPMTKVQQACFDCHQDQSKALSQGVHAEAGRDEEGNKRPLLCSACHGEKVHGILAVDDPNSPVFADRQVRHCGNCHEVELKEYDKSVHGHGLHNSGLLVTAVCSDCHDAHAIYSAEDERSTLHTARVAGTCSQCHRFIEERLRHSVHGGGNGLGGETEEPAPGGETRRHPSCTDCHQGHDLPHPNSPDFRLVSADRCGNCHVDLLRSYEISMHGALTDLGHVPGAKCSDCHGAHDVLSLDNPNCRLAPGENRLATCRKCHPNAVTNFCDFLPHADYKHGFDHNPVLHGIYLSMELLIYSVFAFFGLHSILWFIRSLIHVARHGRPQRLAPGTAAYVRFQGIHRFLHAVVAASFLGLALTGLPIRYSSQPWAQTLAYLLGGFESTSLWHHICGVVTILYFVTHLTWLAMRVWVRRRQKTRWITLILGPDSPVPNLRDFTDMFRMFRWFLGQGPKPGFERWTYWEKFDYWAVFWGVGIIGSTGLVLWFPSLFCQFLPGQVLNVAKIVHSEEALLATSFIFAVHFFGTHLRPEKFPMDMAVLSGLVSEEEMQEERPEFLERMRDSGQLKELEVTVGRRRELVGVTLAGTLALIVGLALLAGIVMAMLGV